MTAWTSVAREVTCSIDGYKTRATINPTYFGTDGIETSDDMWSTDLAAERGSRHLMIARMMR